MKTPDPMEEYSLPPPPKSFYNSPLVHNASAVAAGVGGLSFTALIGYVVFTNPLATVLVLGGTLAAATVVARYLPRPPDGPDCPPTRFKRIWRPVDGQ